MAAFLPFARPDLGDEEIDAVVDTLRSGWITTGPKARAFEQEFAQYVQAPYAVAVNSCTAALHLALEAIGVGPGDEVVVPTLTFAATAEVVRYLGATPVLADVLDADHQLNPAAFESKVSPRTKAVIPVHFAGQAADMDPILEIARQHRIRVIEDAAHSLPASYKGRPIGSIGDVTCFSFYATKTVTTGEGGMATTLDEQLAERMRVMRLHGISKDAWKRYTAEGSWYYEIVAPGFKYNLTDVAAAMGRVQLRRAKAMRDRRAEIAARYEQAFADEPLLQTLAVADEPAHAWHLFVVKVDESALTIDRGGFIEALKARGIGSSVHFIPLHLHPYYRDTYGYVPEHMPVATAAYRRSISLPIYTLMDDADVDRVIDAVLDIVRTSRR